jgi:hypothetical protein
MRSIEDSNTVWEGGLGEVSPPMKTTKSEEVKLPGLLEGLSPQGTRGD